MQNKTDEYKVKLSLNLLEEKRRKGEGHSARESRLGNKVFTIKKDRIR
jgi:hypothetical protein